MQQQQNPSSEHSGLAVVLGWIGGVPASVWAWPHVEPLVSQFLTAYRRSLGPDISALLYFLAPFALFLLVLWLIMFLIDEVLLHGFRQHRALRDFERARGAVFREANGENSGLGWVGWVFIAFLILGALSDKT